MSNLADLKKENERLWRWVKTNMKTAVGCANNASRKLAERIAESKTDEAKLKKLHHAVHQSVDVYLPNFVTQTKPLYEALVANTEQIAQAPSSGQNRDKIGTVYPVFSLQKLT